MLLNRVAEGCFSAIAASFNIAFERGAPKSVIRWLPKWIDSQNSPLDSRSELCL